MLAGFLCGSMLVSEGSLRLAFAATPEARADSGLTPAANRPVRVGKQGPDAPTYVRDVLPILMGKCATCHGDPDSMLRNLLDYETAFGDRYEIRRRVWHSWKGSYYRQPMPPGTGPEAQAMTEEERVIIKNWVEKGAPRGVPPTYAGLQSKAEKIEAGKRLFSTICAACHQPTGQGIAARFPPLAGSDFLNADKHRAIKVVVNGLAGEVVVNGQRFNDSMPRFPLSDHDVAQVLTFVYNSFGNSGKEVTPQEVSAARREKGQMGPSARQGRAAPQEKTEWE